MVGSSFKGNDKDIKLITNDYYFILERALSKSDDGSEVWLAIDEGLLQARLKNSQQTKEDLLQHHRFVMKFTPNLAQQLNYHDNEYQILETIQYRLPYSKSLPSVHCAVAAETCTTPKRNEQTGEIEREVIPNKAFIVLPYITGDSFTHLSKVWAQSDRFDKTHALLPAIAQAFDELTRTDIIHRDISPNNLMQDRHGGVHIIDFGFASDLKTETPSRLGEGTIKYRAPEIIEESEADTRTDQFSLACVFYFLLTGRSPSHGPSAELIEEFNENLPSTLAEVLTKAISDDKNARYNDFTIFFSALKQAFIQDIQARDELRPLQQNIDNWFEYQTGIKQTIEDYQALQASLQAPSTQLNSLKSAGLIGQDKLNTLLSYDNIETNITAQITHLTEQDAAADKHIKQLKQTLNQLKLGENTTVPSINEPAPVKQSDYLKLKSLVDDELEAFNDFLAGVNEYMIGQIEQHSQWPDEALNAEVESLEQISAELTQQKNTFTEQFSKAKKANEEQNKVLTQLNQFISELNQAGLQAKAKLKPSNGGLLTNKAHLIASITERLQSESRIEALISEYQQFLSQCKTFNQKAKQATEQLTLLNRNQQSTQGYWQKTWREASESKLLSTSFMLLALVSIIAGVVYWSPFANNGPEIKSNIIRTYENEAVEILLNQALEQGEYQLEFTDAQCQYNRVESQRVSQLMQRGYAYFACQANTAGKHTYRLLTPQGKAIQNQHDKITVKPLKLPLALQVEPANAVVELTALDKTVYTTKSGARLFEGEYTLKASAKGYHDKVETIQWQGQLLIIQLEAIDNEPPTIELTNIKQAGDTLSMTINAKDNKGLKQLSVKVIQGDKEIKNSAKEWRLGKKVQAYIDWSFNTANLKEGDYKVVYMLEDISGMRQEEFQGFAAPSKMELIDYYKKSAKKAWNENDFVTSKGFYNKASNLDDAEAQSFLARMYNDGLGGKEDKDLALILYLKAAEQGYSNAQSALGHIFNKKGHYETAITWFKKAIENKYIPANFHLAKIYDEHGGGNTKAIALDYYKIYRDLAKVSLADSRIEVLEAEINREDKTYTIGNISFIMKYIPEGSFYMGCLSGLACKKNELPVRRVSIESFHMMETEVTEPLYRECIKENACDEPWGLDNFPGNNKPATDIHLSDIYYEFIPWLNSKLGLQFSLPTEAQWEYAARAGSTTDFSWGEDIDCSKANYGGTHECRMAPPNQNKRKGTTSVKTFKPNAFGLYDMHGNVSEWVQDSASDDYQKHPLDGSAFKYGRSYEGILRGGSWYTKAVSLRSYSRLFHSKINTPFLGYGFRLILSELSLKKHRESLESFSELLANNIVFFNEGYFNVQEKYLDLIKRHASFLIKNENVSITIEGHSSKEDSQNSIYLGSNRAQEVEKLFLALGVKRTQLKTNHFSYRRPMFTNPDGSSNEKNNRVVLVY